MCRTLEYSSDQCTFPHIDLEDRLCEAYAFLRAALAVALYRKPRLLPGIGIRERDREKDTCPKTTTSCSATGMFWALPQRSWRPGCTFPWTPSSSAWTPWKRHLGTRSGPCVRTPLARGELFPGKAFTVARGRPVRRPRVRSHRGRGPVRPPLAKRLPAVV